MSFAICVYVVTVCALVGGTSIKKHAGTLYAAAAILAAAAAAGTAFQIQEHLPSFFCRFFWSPLVKGSLGTAFFVPVMYAAVLKNKTAYKRVLMQIRGELSIIGCILTMGHNAAAGQEHFVRFFTDRASMEPEYAAAAVCSLVMLAVMIPLFITSFPAVRRRMNGKSWKRLQRSAYLFYGLIYVHVLLLTLPGIRDGILSAYLNLAVFTVIFLSYGVLRIYRALEKKKTAAAAVSGLLGAAAAAALVILILPSVRSSAAAMKDGGTVSYADGVYEGSGKGYAGPVTVTVTVEEGRIADISVTDQQEDEPYWTRALVIVDEMVEKQTVRVHSVSGATKSCVGIKKAVKDALSKAVQ